jgi:hypothetical protein
MPAAALVRRLRDMVLLVADSSEAAASLLTALRRVQSPELVAAFSTLVQNRLVVATSSNPVPTDSIWSISDVRTWHNVADAIVLAQYRSELFTDESLRPEVTFLAGLLATDALERTERLREALVPKGMTRESVWHERLAPLADHSSRVYIVDQYAAIALARDLASGRGRRESGATWLLRKLARSPVKRVYLATSASPLVVAGHEPADVRAAVGEWFQTLSASAELELVTCTGRFVHGRRLAFDAWVGFDLHKGLASFDGEKIDETMTLTALPSLASDTRDLFRRLRST